MRVGLFPSSARKQACTTSSTGSAILKAAVERKAGAARPTGPTIASFGGRVLARGDVAEVVEGAVPRRPYFVEFPSYGVAKACFQSAAYQDAIALRAEAAVFDIVIVEGTP